MEVKLHIPKEDIPEMRYKFYMEHGTTMAGLVDAGYKLDYDDWHAYVHGRLPYEDLLKPDPKLREMLLSIPQKKWYAPSCAYITA